MSLEDVGAVGLPRILLKTQPAQSPDLNKLDLCLFNSMNKEAHKIKDENKTYEELQSAVSQMYAEYDWKKIERVHAFQFAFYREILKNYGGNQYDLPHSGIRERQENGDEIRDFQGPVEILDLARRVANGDVSDSSDSDKEIDI